MNIGFLAGFRLEICELELGLNWVDSSIHYRGDADVFFHVFCILSIKNDEDGTSMSSVLPDSVEALVR